MRINLFLHFRWLKKHPKRTNAAIPEFRFYREALRKCAKNGAVGEEKMKVMMIK